MASDFVHLHLHSEYSLLDGACRIKDMVKRGMTLDQVKAAKPTLDYDGRYGDPNAFIDAVYRDVN